MHLSMSSPSRGGGIGHRVGILTFPWKKYQNPYPRAKNIVKISRSKWFTSLLLFEIERSNTCCPIKIPTLGIYATVKFLWVARPPPPPPSGLTLIDVVHPGRVAQSLTELRILISFLYLFGYVICYIACPSVLSYSNLKLHKTLEVKTFLNEKNRHFLLSF